MRRSYEEYRAYLCVSESLRPIPAVGDNTVACTRAGLQSRADARASRAPQLCRSGESGRVLSKAVRPDRHQDDVQRLRSGEDRQCLLAVYQGRNAAPERADGTADVGLALRLEHARL